MRYLYNDLHEIAVRIDLDKNEVFAKLKNGKEQLADPKSNAITDAMIENNQISKEEYDNF